MAITEKELPNSNQWEIKATGDDIPKLAGMLTQTGNEAYRKAFHKNEGNWERITDPQGNATHIPKDRIEEYRALGYGQVSLRPSMLVPDLPWKKAPQAPGKHKYRYNKLTKCMEEV